jgi:hypothetical protein
MKTKGLGWKENHTIKNIGFEKPEGKVRVNKIQKLKCWKNYMTELYNKRNRPANTEVESEKM